MIALSLSRSLGSMLTVPLADLGAMIERTGRHPSPTPSPPVKLERNELLGVRSLLVVIRRRNGSMTGVWIYTLELDGSFELLHLQKWRRFYMKGPLNSQVVWPSDGSQTKELGASVQGVSVFIFYLIFFSCALNQVLNLPSTPFVFFSFIPGRG